MSSRTLPARTASLTWSYVGSIPPGSHIEDEIAQAGSGAVLDYGALEQRVADALGEIERVLHAQVLARLDIDVPAIRVWGDEYRRIGRSESEYHTLAGTVRVMRTVYRKTERNGDTLDPVSVRAGVVADGWLPHTARAMAHQVAQGTSREAEATARELARLPYSRSSFERVGHEVGEVMQLRALQLSDRWAPAVQRATKPLAKPVQIAGVLGARAAANTNRSAAPSPRGHGARTAA
jgi:hypothetical protein